MRSPMDPRKLKRDAAKVHASLKEMEDGTLVTTRGVKIYIPARFAEQQMAFLGTETSISGIFAITVDDTYLGVSLANAMMRIEPTITNYIKIEDEDYIEFVFTPGSVVIANINLLKSDIFIYRIYSELLGKGHVPWFMGYQELGRIFESARHHAGVSVGANHAIVEMIVAAISRLADDRTQYYRQSIKTEKDLATEPTFIPLRSVTYGASNTTAKLVGAYWEEGLTSALVNPSDTVEPIEGLLRR